jgi:pimeloyl-ACP methyl ester carboxylesterase
MGLGGLKTAWQRQTKDFGHLQGDKYSCLVLDNRGIGDSDKPLMRYSTSEMAEDLIEVLDHVGWTARRELHVVGISMGGMIAQEVALKIPKRISSLNLISTGAKIRNTVVSIH